MALPGLQKTHPDGAPQGLVLRALCTPSRDAARARGASAQIRGPGGLCARPGVYERGTWGQKNFLFLCSSCGTHMGFKH